MTRFFKGLGIAAGLVAMTASAALAADPSHRVVNGQRAGEGDIQATVALADTYGEQFCTGTLVAADVVMTAAHCLEGWHGFVEPSEVLVVRGGLDVNDWDENLAAAHVVIGVHPACRYLENDSNGPGPWDESSFGRGEDIAFLRLGERIPGELMRPVPVLPAERRAEIVRGVELVVTGYGVYDVGREVAGVLHTGRTEVARVNEWEIGTQRSRDGSATDSCFGDSGGPLYYTDPADRTWVVGVTSRGRNDSEYPCGDGGIYTFASSYLGLFEATLDGTAGVCQVSDTGGDNGGDWDEDPATIVGEIIEVACELDCCGGSPNAQHPICDGCPRGTVPDRCADPEDVIDADELDYALEFLCYLCGDASLDAPVCTQLCSDGSGVTVDPGEPGDPDSTDEPTEPEETGDDPVTPPEVSDPTPTTPVEPADPGLPPNAATPRSSSGGCSATGAAAPLSWLVVLLLGAGMRAGRRRLTATLSQGRGR